MEGAVAGTGAALKSAIEASDAHAVAQALFERKADANHVWGPPVDLRALAFLDAQDARSSHDLGGGLTAEVLKALFRDWLPNEREGELLGIFLERLVGGATPLGVCLSRKDARLLILQVLLSVPTCNVNAAAWGRQTALELAIRSNRWDAVRALLEFGAGGGVPAENLLHFGESIPGSATPLALAHELGHQACARLLEHAEDVRRVAAIVARWIMTRSICTTRTRLYAAARLELSALMASDAARLATLPLPGGSLLDLLAVNGMPAELVALVRDHQSGDRSDHARFMAELKGDWVEVRPDEALRAQAWRDLGGVGDNFARIPRDAIRVSALSDDVLRARPSLRSAIVAQVGGEWFTFSMLQSAWGMA